MKKIAIVYPELGYAGTDAVAVNMIEALKDLYDVSLITTSCPNLNALNNFFGTCLDRQVKIKVLPITRFLGNSSRARLLKLHMLMRYCQIHKREYDLFISGYGEMDFGVPGIQYIHFPDIDCEAKLVIDRKFYKKSFLRKTYQVICRIVSGYSLNRVRKNLTLANSFWTKNIVDGFYGINSKVIYPPVPNDIDKVKWQNKAIGFVFIGRISPDKRPLEIIQALKKVREKRLDVHVHILGNTGLDKKYVNAIEEEARMNPSWVFYEGKVSRNKLISIVASHRYGISGKKFEHFGIAIAEMVRAGNIVFVNDDGGQVEIVGKNEDLIYHSDDDAVMKIVKIIGDEKLQAESLEKLRKTEILYSKDNFISQIRGIVRKFFKDENN